jgi:hypothetical protein
MTNPEDLARSLDADWPPCEPITLTELVAEARAVEWDFTNWFTRADMTPAIRMLAACLNACWLTLGAKAVPACIDRSAGRGRCR